MNEKDEISTYKNKNKKKITAKIIFKNMWKRKILCWIIIGTLFSASVSFLGRSQATTNDFGINSLELGDMEDPDSWKENTSITLHGRIYYPPDFNEEKKYAAVLSFHGYLGNINNQEIVCRSLAAMGLVAITVSARGHGLSSGTLITRGNESFPDALALYRYALSLDFIDKTQIIAQGESMGGAQAVFLALFGYVQGFFGAYPAIGWIYEDKPLYQSKDLDNSIQGKICGGSEENGGFCSPETYNSFKQLNLERVQLEILEGATHSDTMFIYKVQKLTLEWVASYFGIDAVSTLQSFYYIGYVGAIFEGIVIGTALIYGFIYWRKRRSKKNKKEKKQ